MDHQNTTQHSCCSGCTLTGAQMCLCAWPSCIGVCQTTFFPTGQPTAFPSSSPTITPSFSPSVIPTIHNSATARRDKMEEEMEASSSYFHLERDPASTLTHATLTEIARDDDVRKRRKMISKAKLSKINKETTIRAEQRLFLRNNSIKKIQLAWRNYLRYQQQIKSSQQFIYLWIRHWIERKKYQKRFKSVKLIQDRWRLYRLEKEQKALQKFSQDGKWELRTSHLVFGLILGYLTRSRMRNSQIITKARLSLRDAWTVLEGLITDANKSEQKMTIDQLIYISLHSPQSMSNLKSIDWPFARMFVKEVLVSRGIIWKQMIACRRWSRLPVPGYWYYPVATIPKLKTQASHDEMPAKVSESGVKISETTFENKLEISNSHPQEKEKRSSNPQSLLELLKAKAKNDPNSKFLPEDALQGTQTIESQRAKDSYSKRPATAPSVHTQPPPVAQVAPMVSAPKRRKTNSSKPHLQIDLISADKLVPVKGKPIGGATDRKPGFRVHLFLPAKYCPGGDPDHALGSMKLIQSYSYDSVVQTLFPVFNQVVYLNLPIPPTVEHHEKLSESLLSDYWSHGYVKIEVVDGERFHEEIFLGEACLFLSSLLSDCQRRDQTPTNSSIRSMGGTLPLCKRNPTDRVTGTIHAVGYLHMSLQEIAENHEPVQKKVSAITTPSRKSVGDKAAPENNSNSVNSQTPPSSSKRSNRCPTPPSSADMKVALQRITPTSSHGEGGGLTASERRRRKNTPPSVPYPPYDFDEISHMIPKSSQRSDSPPSSATAFQYASVDVLPPISSGSLNQHPPTVTPTPNRPSTAPDRRNRIAEQLNKLESLANALQSDAESAVQSLNKKLLDRIDEKNEPPPIIDETPHDFSSHRGTDRVIDQNPLRNRRITLGTKHSNSSANPTSESKTTGPGQLEDADVLLANLRRRLSEKKSVK